MNEQLVIERDGIPFTIDQKLRDWVARANGRGYLMRELGLIVGAVRPKIPDSVHRVALYGVPETERLYVKMSNDSKVWQTEWQLQFGRTGKRLSPVE